MEMEMEKISILIILLLLTLSFSLARCFVYTNLVHLLINVLFMFVVTGLIFLILESDFLAFMFLIIYAGAIVILFVCCFMLMSFKPLKPVKYQSNYLVFICFFIIFYLFIDVNYNPYLLLISHHNYLVSDFKIQSLLFDFFMYHKSLNAIEFSTLTKLGIILYKEAWFETLFVGLLILLAITYIVYLFKK